ncbi:MAG TPA: Crp/Fnr family transcriptional regulator [Stellaceae bacterium]|nr:Crp/Fnr family transcriptional regulator [Stellaceae bacterium]
MSRASGVEDARRVLEGCALFRPLAAEERQRLSVHAHLRRFAAGEVIFLKGSPGHGMMAVISGEVRISAPSADGKEIVLNIVHPGEVFGELTLLDGKDRNADAIALTVCEVAMLERRDVVPLLQQRPEICLKLLEVVCERLRRTTIQVEDLLFLELPNRLAKTLLRVAGRRISATGEVGLHVRLSQRELGAMIGGTRESVNKCLGEWQRQGVIRIAAGVIVIADADRLRHIAESEAPAAH